MKKIWDKLQNEAYRFYLVIPNDKMPMEKDWVKTNNYPFFHSKLLWHISRGGNYGIVCGIGNILVIDFDDYEYYNSIIHKLPITFTVQTAKKKLFHLYYHFKGEMPKKTSVKSQDGHTLCDIQAQGSGIIAPGSHIDGKYYSVINDKPIAEITKEQIESIFPIKLSSFSHQAIKGTVTPQPELINITIKVLELMNIDRVKELHYVCPFHESHGHMNLFINRQGSLYCYHECRGWKNIFTFASYYFRQFPNEQLQYKIEVIENDYRNRR